MRVLAIETSCDETAIALLEAQGGLRAPRFKILENLVSSQIAIHRPFGGVVPNLAKREHLKNLPILYRKVFANSKSEIRNSKFIPDLIAVTVGPGLEPALWTGVNFAQEICLRLKPRSSKLKLIGVNHLEGHLYSFLLSEKTGISNSKFLISKLFPAVALIVSGGHTILLKMDSLTKMKKLGETRDDAVGEAFDKVARLLELPYPGGPEIEKLAAQGNPAAIPFPRPMLHSKNYDFSFSGLKTSVLYYLRDNKCPHKSVKNPHKSAFAANIAASFQQAAIDVLAAKTERAAREYKARSIMLSGGVAANSALREELLVVSRKLSVDFFAPPMNLNTDNAAIIGAAGYIAYLRKEKLPLVANGNLNL
ncbi:MAG: tRNA (adenosine(37)-N6)-threonylcarbamoyltransferase complex transferase subunit TsaD [Candidatus Jorgensenbacteria bacterium]